MKRIFVLLFALAFLFVPLASAFAQPPDSNPNSNVPEKNGDFPDPDHPGVRVRVFVHEPKDKVNVTPSAVCSDPDSSAVTGKTGWKLPTGTWTYRLNTLSVPASVGSSNLSSIASNAFNAWTTAISSSAKPSLVYGGSTSKTKSSYDGQNIIAWGRTSGSTLGVTYTRYSSSTGLVVDVDTILNSKFPWSLGTCSTSSYDAADILTHELGHWFGLDDEYTSDYVNNTMYGYGSKAETKKDTPATGDISGINLIY